MKRTFSLLIVFLGTLSLSLIPIIAFGQRRGIVPTTCSGPDCGFPHLMELARNVMDFLIMVSIPLAAIVFAYAGFLFMTAGGSSSQVDKAKGIFTKVLIGFIFVLSAWLIVWTITSALLCDSATQANCGFYNLLSR